MGIDLTTINNNCNLFWVDVLAQNGLVKNSDGTLSVFVLNSNGISSPTEISQQCCNVLATIQNQQYNYDLDTQKCRWSNESINSCSIENPFKIVLNPKGNDGSIFYFQNDENCSLKVDFDYLFKLKCEVLANALTQTNATDPTLSNQIIYWQTQIDEQTVICENISSLLEFLLTEYNNTRYSITCTKFPDISPVGVVVNNPNGLVVKPTELQKEPFTKTGFNGGLAPFSFPTISYITVNFCLTDEGLGVWENILGINNFQEFLGSNKSSYTCGDVMNIYNQNQALLSNFPNATPLIISCDTPFGAKGVIKKQIDELLVQQTECNRILTNLQATLTSLLEQEQALISSCNTPIGVMERLNISMTIDIVEPNGDLATVYENNFFPSIGVGNLYTYLVSHPTDSGFYVCGEPNPNETWATGCTPINYSGLTQPNGTETNVSTCFDVKNYILQGLFQESNLNFQTNGQSIFNQSIGPNILSSSWVHFTTMIEDQSIIDLIANKKIKLTIKVNDSCDDFCILVDEIKLEKICVDVNSKFMFITKSPGFSLSRVIDNKKSWINNDSLTTREFEIKNANNSETIRQTKYDVLDERLVINSKEIDLDMNIARAVEYDVWCYISDNPCLLSGTTNCDPCLDKCCGDNQIDFNNLITVDLSTISTIEGFESLMFSELINVKNRQTISSYATLKALYDRYLNSINYCSLQSSQFDYYSINDFANLIGNYWVDLIEQVIPATTIWGSVKIYSNTIFDQQKFKYRQYSTLIDANEFAGDNVLSPINGVSGQCQNVEVLTTTIPYPEIGVVSLPSVYTVSNNVCISQMNWGSEFIGKVTFLIEE